MPLFRKKPVVVEARRFDGPVSGREIVDWIKSHRQFADYDSIDNTLLIGTLEGDHTARAGDFIVKGVAGEFYPCNPEIFDQAYEPVSAFGFAGEAEVQ